MLSKNHFPILFIITIMLSVNTLYASENVSRFAVFNMEEIMNSDVMSNIRNQTEVIMADFHTRTKSKFAHLEEEAEKIKGQQNIISEESFNLKMQDLQTQVNTLRLEAHNEKQSLERHINQKYDYIFQTINKIIANIAMKNSLDLVMPKPSFQPFFVKSDHDITAQLSKKVDIEFADFIISTPN